MTKEEIKKLADKMLKNGLTAPDAAKIGCFRTCFYPFDDFETENSWYDRENGSDYILVGDYYVPDLKLPEEKRPIIGADFTKPICRCTALSSITNLFCPVGFIPSLRI